MGLAKSAPNEGVAVPSRSRNRLYHEKETIEAARPGQAPMHKGRKHQRERIQKGNNFGREVLSEGGSAAKRKVIVGGVSCSCFCVRYRTCDCRPFGVFCKHINLGNARSAPNHVLGFQENTGSA